jgi:4-hydroxy-tetrahydrodipicolinate reductase
MKKIRLAVFGASGRMGYEITQLILNSKTFSPALGIIRGREADGYLKTTNKLEAKDFKDIDVLIDFSVAEAFSEVLKFAVQNGIPLVSGTTGLSEKDLKALEMAKKKIPVIWAPNMSLGVATLERALEAFRSLEHFDFQIEETHHRNKKDSPSGTAKLLQKKMESVLKRPLPPALAIRGGGVFGVHQVHAMGENETLTFEHRALNRKLFAEGALVAAKWLAGRQKGLYTLQDVLFS